MRAAAAPPARAAAWHAAARASSAARRRRPRMGRVWRAFGPALWAAFLGAWPLALWAGASVALSGALPPALWAGGVMLRRRDTLRAIHSGVLCIMVSAWMVVDGQCRAAQRVGATDARAWPVRRRCSRAP